MPIVIKRLDGRWQVDTKGAFCELLPEFPEKEAFTDVLKGIETHIATKHPEVTKDALKNARGKWYQWILAASAWNWFCHNRRAPAVLLPNKIRFDIADLYEERLRLFILDLRTKVLDHAKVELVTSNPDFLIVDVSEMKITWPLSTEINQFTPAILEHLDKLYLCLRGKCNFKNLTGFISVKTSFRPDRRLQIPHEGSLFKAIYAHLQTRDWIINPKGLNYYAAAMSVGIQDEKALRTVATHSITTVNEIPKAAVDAVFTINTETQARDVWASIL